MKAGILFYLVTLAVHVASSTTPPPRHSHPAGDVELHLLALPPPVYTPHGTPPPYHERDQLGGYPAQPGVYPSHQRPPPIRVPSGPSVAPFSTHIPEIIHTTRPVANRRIRRCVITAAAMCALALCCYWVTEIIIGADHTGNSDEEHSRRSLPQEGDECDCRTAENPPVANNGGNQSLAQKRMHEKRDTSRMSYRRRIATWNDDSESQE